MDVKYISSDWEKMRSGVKSLIGYGLYGKGMFEDLKKLNEVLEDAENDIAKYDVDRAISFSHTSQKSTYQTMFEKFEILNQFTGKVGDLVDRTIDQPFYEDMDAFVSAMEEATISNYTTTNRIGATEMQTYGYEHVTVVEVPKTTVSLDDLLSGGNFYSEQMKLEYEDWKKINPDQDLSQSEFQLAKINMRAFEYESIRDDQENKEFWTQIGALVVIVGVTLLCPPAGLALGAAYGVMELSSAVSGEDWVSGRDLGTGERWFRGLLAPLDILPVGVFSRFAGNATKFGRLTDNIGTVGPKAGIKEGVQQGTNQIDNIADEAAKNIPSRLTSATAAAGDHLPDNILKQAAGDELNSAVSSVPPSLNIPSTRKISDWADDVGEVNKVVPDNSTNVVDDAVKRADDAEIPVREINPEDRAKLDQWAYPPDEQKYLQYKEIYDNPKYYNQENGSINWPPHDGFDGEPTIMNLQEGMLIDRFGEPSGGFFSPEGIPYESRALALHSDEANYYIYEVITDFEVTGGKIAPWFDRPGGGNQYIKYHETGETYTIQDLIDEGYIREVSVKKGGIHND